MRRVRRPGARWSRLMLLLLLPARGCAPRHTGFEVVDDLLNGLSPRTACAVGDDIRPALGCPDVVESPPILHVPAETGSVRHRFDVPPALQDGTFVVQPYLRVGDGEAWHPAPPSFVREPRAATDVAMLVSREARRGDVDLKAAFARIPPRRSVVKTRSIGLGSPARLRGAIAVATVGSRAAGVPVDFRLTARTGGRSIELLRKRIDPADETSGRWDDFALDLRSLRPGPARFAFGARLLPRRGRTPTSFPLWGAPELLERRPRSRHRNLLLVSIDTLRADQLGAYGGALPTSPSLDRLAREGALFEAAIAPYPSTTASHASMLTGVYAAVHGVRNPFFRLPAKLPTLAEVLHAHGYQTGAVTEDGMVAATSGFPRGFSAYREMKPTDGAPATGDVEQTFTAGLAWIERHRDGPFALFLHTYQVHNPYTPPPAFDLFASRSAPVTEQCRRAYAGEIRYVDAELDKVLRGLAALGEAERTIVIVTSDHGEEFGEHGGAGHGPTVYEEVLRVPLIVRAPGIVRAGTRISTPVSLVDLPPTILDLVGVPAPPIVQGRSLVPLLANGSAPADPAIFSETHSDYTRYVLESAAAGCTFSGHDEGGVPHGFLAIRMGTSKWIIDDDPRVDPGFHAQTYDLASDPEERHDVADSPSLARARALRDEFTRQAAAARAALEAEAGAPRAPELDERTREKLRALGYIN